MRALWKVFFIVVPLVAGAWLLGRIVNELVADPWAALFRIFVRAGDNWPFSYIPLRELTWWAVLGSMAIAAIVYVVLRAQEANNARRRPNDGKLAQEKLAPVGPAYVADAYLFMRAIIDPASVFSRITESVQPFTRSLNVRTTLTFRTASRRSPRTVVVPLIMSARGRLENRLSFTERSGARISSLNQDRTNAYIYGVVRMMIQSAGPIPYVAFLISRRGQLSLDEQVRLYVSQASAVKNGVVSPDLTDALMLEIMSLPAGRRSRLVEVATLISQLRLNYPICVPVRESDAINGEVRITVERRVIAEVVGRRAGSRGDRGQPINVAFTVRAWLRRRGASALDTVRQFFGVTSSVLTHELENASRARSYHLEVRGPEGYYAARQDIVDEFGLPLRLDGSDADLVEHAPLRGQRHTHLYLKGVRGTTEASFQAAFNERTPGSMSIALAAALSTLAIASIIAITQVRDASNFCETWHRESLEFCMGSLPAAISSDGSLIQILLTFPIAVLAVSFSRSTPVWGGVLVARAANAGVILLSIGALALSSFATSFTADGLAVAWIVHLGVLGLIAAATLISWLQRTIVHISYVRNTR